jgi:hypothetical protein
MAIDHTTGDIDIDFADRNAALALVSHIPASILRDSKLEKHNTGVYFHGVPIDPITDLSSIDYREADQRGWYKIDLLNVGVYEKVKSEQHLIQLMETELNWELLTYPEFNSKLIHLGNYANLVAELKPASVTDIAMILALIRPGKKHLIQECKDYGFSKIEDRIWIPTADGYYFKKAHAISYAMLVYVNANLLVEQSIT